MRRSLPLLLIGLTALGCRAPSESSSEPPRQVATEAQGQPQTQTQPVAASPEAGAYDPFAHEYVGSERCMPCHVQDYQDWKASSHASTVRPAEYEDEEMVESFIECSGIYFTHVLGDRHHVRFLLEDDERAWGEGRITPAKSKG